MKKLVFPVLFLCGAGALTLLAADSWRKKPYAAWNDEDVRTVLNDSPWARGVDILLSGSDEAAHSSSPMAGGGGGGGNTGQGEARLPSSHLVLRFVSALPIRQAMMRGQYGDDVGKSPVAAKVLSAPDSYYVVAIAGLRRTPVDLRIVREKSTLRAKGKAPFGPAEVRVENGLTVLFFPREGHPIAVEDGDVEVQVRLPDLVGPIRHSFKLKDMVFDGKLEI